MRRDALFSAVLAASILLPLAARPAAAEPEVDAPAMGTTAWWLERARGFAEEINVPDGRAATLVSIGTRYVEAGLLEEARPLLAEAAAFGARCEGCFAKAKRLADLALLRAEAGDPMGAEETFRAARAAVEELEAGPDRISATAYLGARRKDAGDRGLAVPLFAEAFAAAKKLEGEERDATLTDLALTFAVAGEETLANGAFGLLGPREVAEGARLARIALWIQGGELARAEQDLRAEGLGTEGRLSGLVELALAYAHAGQTPQGRGILAEAAELARTVPPGQGRVDALLEVARLAAELGAREEAGRALLEAVGTASARKDVLSVVEGLLACVRTASVTGQRASLRQMMIEIPRLAAGIEDAGLRDEAWLLVVQTAADLGEFVAAERALPSIEGPAAAAQARVDLAEGYREEGNCARALWLANRLLPEIQAWPDEERRFAYGLWRRLAVLQADCGRPDLAWSAVEALGEHSPFHAATACTYVARDLDGPN